MKLHIKNMVCDRCKMVVKTELIKLGLNPINVELGEVTLVEEKLSDPEFIALDERISKFGFSLLTSKKEKIVMQIKSELIELAHYGKDSLGINLSAYLSDKLNLSYANLSSVFSELTAITIEKYFILQKIESAKEMLAYGEKSLSEIAYQLNYSSVAHLSAQFKKVIGMTPSDYKQAKLVSRKSLDEI
jgi:AraC-like DNA-binding protein